MAVVISSGLVLSAAGAAIPLSYPRIMWDDVFRRATVTASSAATGFEAANAANGLTWDYWRPTTSPAWLQAELSEAEEVDYALIAAHSLGSEAVSVKPQYYNGSSWVDLASEYLPGTDRVLAFLFEPVISNKFRLYLSGSDNSPEGFAAVGVAMMGKALAMQRGVVLNNTPITMSRRTQVFPQLSEGGQLLGRSIRREGVMGRIDFRYLEHEWFRTNVEPFIESARINPFGWAWAPTDFPAEVALLWTPSEQPDIIPEYAELPNQMHVGFDVRGIVQ